MLDSPILRRIISGFVAILLLVYVGYQIYNANYSSVKTEVATYAVSSNNIQAQGVAIRKETPIEQNVAGVLTYKLGSGGKVSKGGVVGTVYDSAQNATTEQQIESLDAEITRLTKLNTPGDTYAANPDLLDKQIDQKLVDLLGEIHDGDYAQLPEARNDFLYLLNERQIVVGKEKDFNTRIAALKGQRDSLASANGKQLGQITSPVSGFFENSADGWEGVFDYDKVLSLSLTELQDKMASKPAAPAANVIGKVCGEFDWYFACILPPDVTLNMSVGDSVKLDFPFASTEPVPATIAAMNQANRDSDAVVIFKCSYMNEALASIRNETVQIQLGERTGIMVSQKAIHFQDLKKTVKDENGKTQTVEKNVKGVYVIHGSELKFVEIVPLYNDGSYVICKMFTDTSEDIDQLMTKESIKLYDEVVIEGTDLYDGKVVK